MSERDAVNNPIVWSFGGGVQSAALAVLIANGTLPRPDFSLMADTGRERSETWDYLRDVIQPLLLPHGVQVEVIPPSYATVGLRSHLGSVLVPAFTDFSGAIGQLPTYCSTEWKVRPIHRRLRELGVTECAVWLGISADEAHRAKASRVKWITHEYPLLDLLLKREACSQLVIDAGLPAPPRSSCWMCPHSGQARWLDLKRRYPDEFAKAVAVDKSLRDDDGGSIYLHRSGRPLDEAVSAGEAQGDLFNGCDSGYCWT